MSDNLVTIIMPAYNAAKTIEKSIRSVVAQTYKKWQLLIIDDGSEDETRSIVETWADIDDRIISVPLEKRSGVAAARNRGLDLALGKYIAFLDSDDTWVSDKLDVQIAFMLEKNTAITFSSYYRVNERQEVIGIITPPAHVNYNDMLRSNFIGNSTAIFIREQLKDIRFKQVGNEDHLFWLDCLRSLNATVYSCLSKEPLVYYLVSPKSLSGNKFKSLSYEWLIYRNELGFGRIKSSFYICHYIYNGFMKRKLGRSL